MNIGTLPQLVFLWCGVVVILVLVWGYLKHLFYFLVHVSSMKCYVYVPTRLHRMSLGCNICKFIHSSHLDVVE